MLASLACVSLVWVSLGIFCGLVSYSAKLWGQSPDVLLPIVTTIVYGLIVGLPSGLSWLYGTPKGPFNIHITHTQAQPSPAGVGPGAAVPRN